MASRRDVIAQVALAHVGCSSVLRADVYQDVVRRPADAAVTFDSFYLHNSQMSSCGLFALGCLRMAGCSEPECVGSYFPSGGPERDAVVDVQALARRFAAWRTGSPPVPPFLKGDVWIIADSKGNDAHVGVCVADAVINQDSTWTQATVEGGQFSGKDSSAIGAFSRMWHFTGNRWMLGGKFLVGYASAGELPVPDTIDPDPGLAASAGHDGPHT